MKEGRKERRKEGLYEGRKDGLHTLVIETRVNAILYLGKVGSEGRTI
jgi:hypothetical protein